MFTPREKPQRRQIASLILSSSVLATSPMLASESDVMFHVAGYADTTLTSVDGGDSEFTYTLAPIVHMQVGESFFSKLNSSSRATIAAILRQRLNTQR
jgi:hypothetical protein